ncbi:locomotion-related protein Hikaru genki-like [Antedon mediterranea]|uniref:locomotion-related protein Hikaru genki-like n=1 Tax=Antedon mediterranea TaxID=105859 RepID=UPI003AF95217
MYCLNFVFMLIGAIFIKDVAGDCPRPDKDSHVVTFINGRFPLRLSDHDEFPEGTTLVSRCRDVGRYRFRGRQNRECVGDSWSAPPPACELSESQLITETGAITGISNNGSIIIAEDKKQPLHITCRVGEPELSITLYDETATAPTNFNRYFRASKTLTIKKPTPSHSGLYTCNDAMDEKQKPMTVEIIILESAPMCDVPEAPVNGERSHPDVDQIPMSSEIVYSCDNGFSLEGEQFARCTTAGVFDVPPPRCVGHLCPPPPSEFKNGRIIGGDFHVGSSLGFLCDVGFHIMGEDLRSVECLPSLEWSGKFPKGCRPDPTNAPTTEPPVESNSSPESEYEPSDTSSSFSPDSSPYYN